MSTDALKNRILAATPLADLIGEHVQLTEKGNLRVGCCPFHEENSASFTVYPDHYFCFGCRENGDAISFVRKMNGLGFIDTLKVLGARVGIDTSELDLQKQARLDRQDDAKLYQCMVIAQDWFKANLHGPRGEKSRQYLQQRGFSPEAIQEFGFGLALDEHRTLTDYLQSKHRMAPRDIEACSLATPSSKNGQLLDFFRNRLMIPIYDTHGRLVAFGGRAIDDYPPKYKNSRETVLFDKSSVLFGFQRAREYIRKSHPAIICEGYMDVLQLWNKGFPGAVACMGVALKPQHLRLLTNVTNKAYLVFDGDQAGQKASLGTVGTSLEFPKLDLRVVTLPVDDDPDTFVQKNGSPALSELIAKSDTLLDTALKHKLSEKTGLALADAIQKEIIPWLSNVEDTFRRDILVNRVCFYSGISKDIVLTEIQKHKQGKTRQGATLQPTKAAKLPAPARTLNKIEFEFMGHLFFAEPTDVDIEISRQFVQNELELDELWLQFAEELLGTLARGESPHQQSSSSWAATNDPQVLALLDSLQLRAQAFATTNRAQAFLKLRTEYALKKRQLSIGVLRAKLKTTPPSEVHTLLTAIMNINKEIASLEKSIKS